LTEPTGTSIDSIVANATATGGAGETGLLTGGTGGAATATSNASSSNAKGSTVSSTATAIGGAGPGGAGIAMATATGTGPGGTVDAHAATSLPAGARVISIIADASDGVYGASTAISQAAIGTAAPAFIFTGQSVALATGAPLAADTNLVTTANPSISGAILSNPSFLALAELGGAAGQTSTNKLEIKVALNSTDLARDLVVGLYGGTGAAGGTLDINANGTDTKFTFTGATADAFFNDHPIDLGSLSGSAYAAGVLDLTVTLQVTTPSPGSAFHGGVIVTG
jgi:hypothetical protein